MHTLIAFSLRNKSLVIVLTLAISRRSNTLAPVANLSVMQRAVAPPGLPIQK